MKKILVFVVLLILATSNQIQAKDCICVTRSYTVEEIDDLRDVVTDRVRFGTVVLTDDMKWTRALSSLSEEEQKVVEEFLRTYMIAGKTAEDIKKEDKQKELRKKQMNKNLKGLEEK